MPKNALGLVIRSTIYDVTAGTDIMDAQHGKK